MYTMNREKNVVIVVAAMDECMGVSLLALM